MKLRRRESGAETELTPGLVVGRLAECGLQLQDGSVSRRHAKLELRGSSWWVVDLGSSNGTFRNGERGKEFELRGGDLVTFGAVAFEFVAAPESDAIGAGSSVPELGELDLGSEIELEDPSEAMPAAAAAPAPAAEDEPPSRATLADQERARIRQELKQAKRSSGLGDLSQLSFPMQCLVALLAIAVVAGMVLGIRALSGAIAPTA